MNKSQQHVLGSLIIIIILLLAAIPALMFVNFIDIVSSEVTPPVVNTNATTNIGSTSATLNGYLQFNGSTQTWYGIRYGLSEDFLTNNVTVGTSGTNGTVFNYEATGLNEGTVYFVQAWANNSNSFSNGTTEAFWTNSTWANSSLNNRTRIVINHTYIDEDLYDFPALVMINSTIGLYCDSGNSIRFYKNSTTQYYYEIDTWNTTENSSIWVNVTHIYNDGGAIFYMYYNDTNAVSNSSVYTWNSNFIAVWHMSSNASGDINDSTINANNLIKHNTPVQVPGKIGYSQTFLPINTDYFNSTYAISPVIADTNNVTYEAWVNRNVADTRHAIAYEWGVLGGTANEALGIAIYPDNKTGISIAHGAGKSLAYSTDTLGTGYWGYATGRYDGEYVYASLNGTIGIPVASVNTINSNDTWNTSIGVSEQLGNPMNGSIDELRISNISRSNAWIKASFNSMNQTFGFLTFEGEQDELTAPFLIVGIADNRITWQATPNSYAWCNATGTTIDTLELNMTINATTNITQIRIWVGDSNDTGNYVNASNISAVFSSDNTTWNLLDVNTTSFVDGGSNITLNASTWNDTNGMYGVNPFNGSGLTNTATSIFCRFRLDTEITQAVDIYWNSTVWRVYLGYIV